jgi:hypothetical protein
MPQPFPELPWLALTTPDTPSTTIAPEVATQLLAVCAELLATTFVVLQHEISSLDGWNMLKHLRRAQEEVEAAQAWQGQTGGA